VHLCGIGVTLRAQNFGDDDAIDRRADDLNGLHLHAERRHDVA
jgi:hypothetical protein